jgi:hypothetical protein
MWIHLRFWNVEREGASCMQEESVLILMLGYHKRKALQGIADFHCFIFLQHNEYG